MTEEKSIELAEILNADEETAKRLLAMSPEEAAAELRAKGCDFSPEELLEFGEGLNILITAKKEQRELTEEELDKVSGGCLRCAAAGAWTAYIIFTLVAVSIPW